MVIFSADLELTSMKKRINGTWTAHKKAIRS